MITDSYSATEVGMRPVRDGAGEFRDELETMLREEQRKCANEAENELSIFRSGSAPPTVEGSFSALFGGGGGSSGGVSEEELRADPSYAQYYRSNVNLNPRLPPPLAFKENWRLGQCVGEKVGAGGSGVGIGLPAVGDRRKVIGRTSGDVGVRKKEENVVDSRTEWDGNGLIGLRQKSFAEIIQDDVNQAISVSGYPSQTSTQAYDNTLHPEFTHLEELTQADSFYSGLNNQGMSALQKIESAAAQNYASAFGASLSRSTTPDPQHIAKAPSPRVLPVGGGRPLDKRNSSILKTSTEDLLSVDVPTELDSAFSGMSLSANTMLDDGRLSPFQTHPETFYDKHRSLSNSLQYHNSLQPSADAYFKGSSVLPNSRGGNSPSRYSDIDNPNSSFPNYGLTGAARSPFIGNQLGGGNLSPFLDDIASARAMGVDSRTLAGGLTSGLNSLALASELASLRRFVNQSSGSAQQMPMVDPLYLQYLRSSEYVARYSAALNDPMFDRESHGTSFAELLEMHKSYLETLLLHYKSQYGLPYHGKPNNFDGYYGNAAYGLGMPHAGHPFAAHILPNSPVGIRHGERSMRFPSGMHNFNGSIPGSWNMDLGDNFGLSMLDQFKGNKSKSFELSEIAGHVVEFSADQYGSRFIQQKLETATPSERDMVFDEIMPHALTLMTDVFGNYVIQKFFEHGTPVQIRELAEQLTGHVLALSLQMYGCRVIQKAIEVIDLDQQKKMVVELDGHIIRCVRDQNGNHVIQKCIECVPEEAIHFIVETFFTQVVALSTHPYGCRVIQRVLEHCHDPKTQSIVMDEIMQCVCVLAQDQYGNYVIQHVLEHGKPDERSLIISQLTEQIVQMSQQKFASNVVEKCLAFGTPEERQTLVNKMLGTSDENEPLQAMMKDQFANYVVQKVLETCNDQQLELILGRIKVHLNALKKYTYGKHIVARVEKLVATGEKRIGIMSSNPPAAA